MLKRNAINRQRIFSTAFILLMGGAVFSQSAEIPLGQNVVFRSEATNEYLVTWGQGPATPIHATALHADDRATTAVVDAGNGYVALRSQQTKMYWSVDGTGPDANVYASASQLSDSTLFTWIQNADGTVSLKSKTNNRYLAVVEADTIITPHIDSATLASVKALQKAAGNNFDRKPSLVADTSKFKPYVLKYFLLRAVSDSIGKAEEFDVTTMALEKEGAVELPSKVLTFLYGISGKQTVAGIHNAEPNSDPTQYTNWIYSTTGKYPGLWGGDFLYESNNIADRGTMINEGKNEWNEGAVVTLMYHMCPPTAGESCGWGPGTGDVQSSLSDAQWTELTTDGSALNVTFKQRLKNLAPFFQTLKDNNTEVLFRLFHEMNQSDFWWGGRSGPTGTARLFQIAHDYIIDTLGFTNVYFVWSVQDLDLNFSGYNPGENYWDVFSLDVYGGDGYTTAKYNAMLDIAGSRLIAIAECGVIPSSTVLTAQPRWAYFSGWASLVQSDNSTAQVKDSYTATNTLSRDEMPGWANVTALPTPNAVLQRPVAPNPDLLLSVSGRFLEFELPTAGPLSISLHNADGQRVGPPVSGVFSAGAHSISLGENMKPGIYFAKIMAGNQPSYQKICNLGP